MLDLIIRGGDVVDGTGARHARADVGIQGDRIVADRRGHGGGGRRSSTPPAKLVTPGFIDVHTHFDAQVFWDGALTPSPLHGVTTALGRQLRLHHRPSLG